MKKIKLTIMRVWRRRVRVRVRFLILVGVMIGASLMPALAQKVEAESCPDLKIVFVRGSGAERWSEQNYLEFKKQIEDKLPDVSYEFLDLNIYYIQLFFPISFESIFFLLDHYQIQNNNHNIC